MLEFETNQKLVAEVPVRSCAPVSSKSQAVQEAKWWQEFQSPVSLLGINVKEKSMSNDNYFRMIPNNENS